jgi:adenylate cyclase
VSRVFLSYAREDADAARQLAEQIAHAGHDVWWDRHLHGGSRFVAEIDKALREAEAVVVLWTAASVESAWVQDEAAEGRDSGRLVPVTIGSVKPPLGFRQFHTVAIGEMNADAPGSGIEELLSAIARTCGPDPRSEQQGTAQAETKPRKIAICVLPFANMSGEAEQEYFSDGISEDIITDLSKVSALSVVARNTAFTFKGQTVDVKEIAKSLSVSHVLEGSVRKAGNRVRITAQLIDGSAGDHVCADRNDRDLTDIFEIQDEISKAIVEALRVKLLPREKSAIEHRGTSNVDAYNLYLMARQQWTTGTFGHIRRDEAIVRLCRQATLLDPHYSDAWALMGLAQLELRFWHGKDEDALDAGRRALAVNPNMPEALCIQARYLEEEGQGEEALRQIRAALQLNPESWEVNREAARMLFRHDNIGEAIPFFEKAASLMDGDWHNPSMLITCYNSIGDTANLRKAAKTALERAERAIAKDPTNGPALAVGASALCMFGDEDRARDWIARALLLDPDNLSMRYNLACSLARELGDPGAALDTLQLFFEKVNSPMHIRHLEVDPDLDEIRGDPCFKAMLAAARERLGMAQSIPMSESPAAPAAPA